MLILGGGQSALVGRQAGARMARGRFTALVGQPPLAYLTWWRMTSAGALLRGSDASLHAVGERTGYASALLTGSLGQLLLAGVWVGLAFQAKMIQGWLALPALAAAYLLAAPAALLTDELLAQDVRVPAVLG